MKENRFSDISVPWAGTSLRPVRGMLSKNDRAFFGPRDGKGVDGAGRVTAEAARADRRTGRKHAGSLSFGNRRNDALAIQVAHFPDGSV